MVGRIGVLVEWVRGASSSELTAIQELMRRQRGHPREDSDGDDGRLDGARADSDDRADYEGAGDDCGKGEGDEDAPGEGGCEDALAGEGEDEDEASGELPAYDDPGESAGIYDAPCVPVCDDPAYLPVRSPQSRIFLGLIISTWLVLYGQNKTY